MVYAVFFNRLLPGPASVKGLAFGLVLWLASQLLVVPMIGAGLFCSHMGGARAAGTLLLGRLIYGVLLGSLAGSAVEVSSVAEPRTKEAA